MEIIFTKTIPGIAPKGLVKNVKPGFFRNYLQPRGLAVLAGPGQKASWAERMKDEVLAKEELRQNARAIQDRFTSKTFVIAKKATAKGTLYSAVDAADIAKALKEQANVDVDAKHMIIKSHLKKVGTFELPVELVEGVEVVLSLDIQAKAGGKK